MRFDVCLFLCFYLRTHVIYGLRLRPFILECWARSHWARTQHQPILFFCVDQTNLFLLLTKTDEWEDLTRNRRWDGQHFLSWFTEISRCDCIYPVEGSMTWNLQHFIKSILILVYIFLPIMPHGFVWEVRRPVDSRAEVIPDRGLPWVHITIYFYRYLGRDHCLQSMFKDNSTHNDEAP